MASGIPKRRSEPSGQEVPPMSTSLGRAVLSGRDSRHFLISAFISLLGPAQRARRRGMQSHSRGSQAKACFLARAHTAVLLPHDHRLESFRAAVSVFRKTSLTAIATMARVTISTIELYIQSVCRRNHDPCSARATTRNPTIHSSCFVRERLT